MSQAELTAHDDAPVGDHRVFLWSVSWADYERLLRMRGDRSAPRICYLEGVVEIMSPSEDHESVKSRVGCLVEAYCLSAGIEFDALGSWTLKVRKKKRGAEPDECYRFGEPRKGAFPDLVIEVVWTSGGIDKLDLYRKLGIRELWLWQRGKLQPYVLRGERYEETSRSEALPDLDLDLLVSCLDRPTTSQSIRDFQAALQRR